MTRPREVGDKDLLGALGALVCVRQKFYLCDHWHEASLSNSKREVSPTNHLRTTTKIPHRAEVEQTRFGIITFRDGVLHNTASVRSDNKVSHALSGVRVDDTVSGVATCVHPPTSACNNSDSVRLIQESREAINLWLNQKEKESKPAT